MIERWSVHARIVASDLIRDTARLLLTSSLRIGGGYGSHTGSGLILRLIGFEVRKRRDAKYRITLP